MQQLLGNRRLLAQLRAAATENRIAHAYLLCGGEGSGKKTLAGIMSHLFLCPTGGCGSCAVCDKIQKGVHPDVITLTGATKSGAYTVDQIRRLRREALTYPNEGKKKVYILQQAEKLTPNAQDAFLKILEEPPEFVVFILLCSDESKLLSTIHSRVIRLAMEIPEREESAKWLLEQSGEDPALIRTALSISGGNPGQALALLSDGQLQMRMEQCQRFCSLLTDAPVYDLAAFCHQLAADKAQFAAFIRLLCMYLRDVLVYRTTHSSAQLMFGESITLNHKCVTALSLRNLPGVIVELQQLAEMVTQPFSILLLETRLVTLCVEKLVRQ